MPGQGHGDHAVLLGCDFIFGRRTDVFLGPLREAA